VSGAAQACARGSFTRAFRNSPSRITKGRLDDATWDPQTGGTFQKIVAHLSIDKKGLRGDQPGFDPSNVAVYGLGLDPGGLTYGQTTWSGFARSTGFQLLNKNPWGTHYNYGDRRFVATIAWWRRMIAKGWMPPLDQARTLGQTAMGFSPQPRGLQGSWSMYNGLADSIWVGTKHPNEAWQWVKFLSSPTCEKIVGTAAVVFPAIPAGVKNAVATHKKQGIDVSAFLSYLKTKHTLLYPITAEAPQIDLLVQPTIEKILIGDEPASKALPDVNNQVNDLLKYR
jgi:multiple sugar transport system substrate-binding protein